LRDFSKNLLIITQATPYTSLLYFILLHQIRRNQSQVRNLVCEELRKPGLSFNFHEWPFANTWMIE